MFCGKCNEKIQGVVYCYMDKFYCKRECVQTRIEQDNNKELLKVIGPLPKKTSPTLQRSNSKLDNYGFYDFFSELF